MKPDAWKGVGQPVAALLFAQDDPAERRRGIKDVFIPADIVKRKLECVRIQRAHRMNA